MNATEKMDSSWQKITAEEVLRKYRALQAEEQKRIKEGK